MSYLGTTTNHYKDPYSTTSIYLRKPLDCVSKDWGGANVAAVTQGGGQKIHWERYTGSGKLTYSYTAIWLYTYTPVKQTWNLKMPPSKRKTYLQSTVFFGGGVMFFFFSGGLCLFGAEI